MKKNKLLILSILAIVGLGSNEKALAEGKSFTSCRVRGCLKSWRNGKKALSVYAVNR